MNLTVRGEGMTNLKEEVKKLLKTVSFFNLLPQDVLDVLEQKVIIKTYPLGTYVFMQGGESLNTLFLIISGSADVVARNDMGEDVVVGFRGVEDFFGETGLTGERYSGSIRVKEELTCLLIPGDVITHLIGQHKDFAGYLTEFLVARMRSLYDGIIREQNFEAYRKVDTPLFRKRISDIMSSPVVSCSTTDSIVNVANLMKDKKINAVIVVNEDNKPVGVISTANMIHKVIAKAINNYRYITAGEIMNPELISISSEAFFAEALLAVSKFRTKQLAVTSGGRLIGIVTVADLVKTRSTGTLTLIHDIELQQDISGLVSIGKEVDNLLNALVAEKAPVPEILIIISDFRERLTKRVIQLAEQEMINKGYGPPPVDYCWLNTGSAGRREQTSSTDQDNFIIFREHESKSVDIIREYFLKMSELANEDLSRCGFTKCPGNVMASNPNWCRSLSEWVRIVEHWVESSGKDPQSIRQLTIMLDFKPVHGDKSLSDDLWKKVISVYQESAAISHLLTQDDLSARVPVTIWGGFSTEKSGPHKNEINLKNSVIVHIISCIRIFALKNGICLTSTFGRLAELRKIGALKGDDVDFIETAHETLMMFRIRENLKKVNRGEKPDNYINPTNLSKQEREILKDAITAVSRLQKLTAATFTLLWMGK